MVQPPVPLTASDEEVRALLERYGCPVPFHQVRTRFLGNIATPAMEASPITVVQSLWGGALPEFESIDAFNELLGALIMGLWNRLTRHQERKAPFWLVRTESPATRHGLASLALMRREELDGFIEGLFGDEDDTELPERAERGLDALGELRALFAATVEIATDESKATTGKDLENTLRSLQKLTTIAEREIHAVVLSCARARRRMLASVPAQKLHRH